MKKLTLIPVILLVANMLFGQINKIDTSFYSESLDETMLVDVYFPPGYDEHPDWHYPVIYYLHSWGGNQNQMGYILLNLQNYINDSIIDPVIMVCAENNPPPFGGSMYVNSILWGDYEEYMVNDLVNWIELSFRVVPERDYRALMGHSMGSFGSFRYGILYKEKFKALAAHAGQLSFDYDLWLEPGRQQIILENPSGPPYFYNFATGGSFTKGGFLLSGAFTPDTNSPQTYINPQVVDYFLDENANFIDSTVAKWQAFDIIQLIHQLSPSDSVGIYFGCGTSDDYLLYPSHLAMKDTLDSLLMPPGPFTRIDQLSQQKDHLNLGNYPNPFTNSTTIQFELLKSGYLELSIYNHLGQKIEMLFKGNLQAGKQKTIFNASNLSPGIYFLHLQTGNEVVTKKIIKL